MAGVFRRSHQGALLLVALFANHSAHALDANALPTGGTVSAGSATIATVGSSMTVNQSSQNLAINWQSFNIGSNAGVTFNQPNASAIALNRVLGTDGTQILGSLKANGQVWILNPNGVLFGKGAQVDVGGLVASTLNLSDADFLAGKRSFSGAGGSVVNLGEIHAGYVALLGEQAVNEGVIVANLGTVVLAAGNRITLDFNGDRLLNVQVDEGALKALADNKGLVQADGGTIVMTARAKDALLDTAVNNSGILQARTVANEGGVIKLLGDMGSGTANVGGTVDATGGFVETSAHKVKVQAGTTVRAGHWLIDPTDITIDDALAGTLQGQLAGGDATVQTQAAGAGNGDILVNSGISWSAHTLTLSAHRNIAINAPLNGSGSAGLAFEYGLDYQINAPVNLAATGSFSTKSGSGPTISYAILTGLTSLQGMNNLLAGNYVLGADIDASGSASWNGGAGFMPVGSSSTPFIGRFDGLGHTISGLTINRPTADNVGLFGWTDKVLIRNVGIVNASVTGQDDVGALAGVAASPSGTSSIDRVYTTGSVSGRGSVGGLVGVLSGWTGNTTLSNSFSTANVTGSGDSVGGLVGYVYSSGGLAIISQSYYAAGSVTGHDQVGGLVGILDGAGGYSHIENSYATGSVTGNNAVGGLVGRVDGDQGDGSVYFSYAAGPVSGNTHVGGIAGEVSVEGNVYFDVWDTLTTGQSNGSGLNLMSGNELLAGQTTAEMKTLATFTNNALWSDIDAASGTGSAWRIYEGQSYPVLRAFQKNLTVTANDAVRTYDGTAYSGGNGVAYSASGAPLSGTPTYAGTAQGAVNVGSYAITPGGLSLNPASQQDYQNWSDIVFVNGTLTISAASSGGGSSGGGSSGGGSSGGGSSGGGSSGGGSSGGGSSGGGSSGGGSGGTARTPAEMVTSSPSYAGALTAAQAGQPAATLPASAGAPRSPAATSPSVAGLPGLEIAEEL